MAPHAEEPTIHDAVFRDTPVSPKNAQPKLQTSNENPSFVLQKPYTVTYEHRPIPQIGPHDVLVHVQYTGICGSDVHYWKHGAIGQYVVREPMVLGHESSGIVTRIGRDVTTLAIGDRVAMEPGTPCRRCAQCRGGKYNLCPDMRFAATPPTDGTLAKYYAVPEDFCYKLADHVTLEEGALAEPLAVAVHVVRQAGVRPGDSVLVCGAGPVGVLCCAVARVFGASAIMCMDLSEGRLAFARSYAATHTHLATREPPQGTAQALRETLGRTHGLDVAIDATGAEPCIQTCLHALRTGGSYVQAGMGRPDITFPIGAFCGKEITARGSFRYRAGDYALAVGLLANGQVSVRQLITGVVRFEEAERAFELVGAGAGIKTLIAGVDVPDTSQFAR